MRTALARTNAATALNLENYSTVTGLAIESEEPSGTSAKYLMAIDGGDWETYDSGTSTWVSAATQAITASSVLSEGNTKAELLALTSTALDRFAGHTVDVAVAMSQSDTTNNIPSVTSINFGGQSNDRVTRKTVEGPEISLTELNAEVEIIDITVDKEEAAEGTATILAATKDHNGNWSEYQPYTDLLTSPATVAKSIKFKAVLDAPNPGVSSATIRSVSIRHRTDNVAVFSEGTGVCLTKTKNFVNTIGRAHAMIKHPIVKDTEVSVHLALREPPVEVKSEALGVGDGTQHTATLAHTENLASHGFVLYFNDGAQNTNSYPFSTADGQVTYNAPEGASVTCDYIYGWEAERFVEMVHDMMYPDADDNNLVDDQFDYIATNAGDPTGSVGTLRIEIKQNKGTVRDEVLGTGTGSLQAFVLAHHAKPETISVTPAGAEWTYREKTDTILVTAAAGAEIKASYDWAARTNYIESIGCIFNP